MEEEDKTKGKGGQEEGGVQGVGEQGKRNRARKVKEAVSENKL